ncbi:MAG: hypothetical protein QOF61_3352 [Acidobacteriota bacterium]|nr:hypothetical protein [Acidobacteriota bacterium]
MKHLVPSFILIITLVVSHNAQNIDAGHKSVDVAARKFELLNDLRALAEDALKLDQPLARAAADAEIADAAWSLDREWAKTLLLGAFRLTFPAEGERRPVARPIGAAPRLSSSTDRARNQVRARIFNIAGREKSFTAQLAQEGVGHVDRLEEDGIYAELARRSLASGNKEDAINYSLRAFEIDAAQSAGGIINDLALQDRAAADKLLLNYIESLKPLPVSDRNGSLWRIDFTLAQLIFPNSIFFESRRNIPSPGAEVMRAYVGYVIETLSRLAQTEPDRMKFDRSFLLSAWLPLRQYAPELTPTFMELERLTRTPGQNSDLPTQSHEERDKEYFDKMDREALKSDRPDERSISSLISRGEFDTARKLIGKLPDGEQKAQLSERLNMSEALSLVAKDDISGASRLAERLTTALSINRVYPAIVNKCAARKDQLCVTSSVYQAVKQLKVADRALPVPPAGIPASALSGDEEIDPVLSSLGQLAKAVAQLDSQLAAEVLDEMVEAANRSRVDTGQGRTGFEPDVFKTLAKRDESRARQSADGLKDRLRRLTAMAEIYQWKVSELKEKP